MPQLRVALAQIDPTVGDLDGNADLIADAVAEAAEAGAHLVVTPEMCLTGYPIEDLAFRPSFVDASRLAIEAAGRAARRGGARRDRRRRRLPRPGGPAARAARQPEGVAAERRGGAVRRPCRRTPGQAPPVELRRRRRDPQLRARRHDQHRAGPWRRRRDRDLRGPVAGRPLRGGRRCRGGPAHRPERLALRAQQGRRAARAVLATSPRGRLRPGLRQPARRSGRAGLRRRLDRGRCVRGAGRPGEAVRARAARRRPRPAGRDRGDARPRPGLLRALCTPDGALVGACPVVRRRERPRSRRRSRTSPRSTTPSSSAYGTTCARTGSGPS